MGIGFWIWTLTMIGIVMLAINVDKNERNKMENKQRPSATARRIAFERGWPVSFAREYVMERNYNGLNHQEALNKCYESKFVSRHDKRIVKDVEAGRVM